MVTNIWLFVAGVLSSLAAVLHLGCIIGGGRWYRSFGAGERLARLAERGSAIPGLYALAIAVILGCWSAYAFSGSGVILRLPLLRSVLVLICAVYLLRAAALPLMLAYWQDAGRSASFLVWSSAVVLIYGLVHAVGLYSCWSKLLSATWLPKRGRPFEVGPPRYTAASAERFGTATAAQRRLREKTCRHS